MSQPPEVQNVVSLAKLNATDLDLYIIAQKSESSRYNPKRFPAVIMRKTEPKSTVGLRIIQILIFKSGKLIIIGAKSEVDARTSADKSAKDISRLLDKKLRVETFAVTNIVANADIGMKIDIGQLAQSRLALKDETFPGVIYRMGNPVKAVLVFSSGKIVFTGARTKNDIDVAFEMLKKEFIPFKSKKEA